MAEPTLATRCAEVIAWRTTGLLADGELRKLAEKAPHREEHQRLMWAESVTTDEAMRFVISRTPVDGGAKEAPSGNFEIYQVHSKTMSVLFAQREVAEHFASNHGASTAPWITPLTVLVATPVNASPGALPSDVHSEFSGPQGTDGTAVTAGVPPTEGSQQ
jgi:hypothetical protein